MSPIPGSFQSHDADDHVVDVIALKEAKMDRNTIKTILIVFFGTVMVIYGITLFLVPIPVVATVGVVLILIPIGGAIIYFSTRSKGG